MPATPRRALEEKAQEFEINNLDDFYTSRLFTSSGFQMHSNYITFKA